MFAYCSKVDFINILRRVLVEDFVDSSFSSKHLKTSATARDCATRRIRQSQAVRMPIESWRDFTCGPAAYDDHWHQCHQDWCPYVSGFVSTSPRHARHLMTFWELKV